MLTLRKLRVFKAHWPTCPLSSDDLCTQFTPISPWLHQTVHARFQEPNMPVPIREQGKWLPRRDQAGSLCAEPRAEPATQEDEESRVAIFRVWKKEEWWPTRHRGGHSERRMWGPKRMIHFIIFKERLHYKAVRQQVYSVSPTQAKIAQFPRSSNKDAIPARSPLSVCIWTEEVHSSSNTWEHFSYTTRQCHPSQAWGAVTQFPSSPPDNNVLLFCAATF